MKRFLLSIAAAGLAFFGAAPTASAHGYPYRGPSTYVSNYARCGCPVYVQRFVAFYDGWGRPVWRTRVLPISHRCGWGRPAPYYRGGYGGGYRGGRVVIRGRC